MRKKRAEFSEKVFEHIKWNIGFKQFILRCLDKVDIEWGLLDFAFNIKKMNKKEIEKNKKIAMAKAISLSKNIYTQKFQQFLTGIFAFGFLF